MEEELKLADYTSHIILTEETGRKKTVLFCDDIASLHKKLCQSRVRVSPCFRIVGSGLNENAAILDGHHVLFFIGPLAMERISRSLLPGARMWLSYGAYNLLWLTNSDEKAQEMEEFLMKDRLRYECWNIDEQQIVDFHYGEWEVHQREPISSKLFEIFAHDEVMMPVVREYTALITAAICRLLYMDERTYRRMRDFHHQVEEYAISLYEERGNDAFFYYLTSINACLTRYNEQMVAACSPIVENPATTNSHSLLGLGMASLGINNIGDSFIRYIADQHIIDKLVLMMEQPYIEDKTLPQSTIYDNVFVKNHLDSVILSNPDPSVPLLLYFSSRDGFRRQYHTVSIPLVSVYNSTTRGWSLKTLTHEMSHTEVEWILKLILNNLNFENSHHDQPTTYKEALQQLFLTGMMALSKDCIPSKHSIKQLIDMTYDEMNEIITHAFDFYYFYNDNLKEYIHDIWYTWEELPSITQNVENYIRRSLCIVELYLMDHKDILREKYQTDDSIGILLNLLQELEKVYHPVFNHQYIGNAINLLNSYQVHNNLRQRIITEITNRKFLLKFSRGFLFSPIIRETLEQQRKSLSTYNFENLRLGDGSLYGPIVLLERVAKEVTPCHAKACLLYYHLAFNHVFNS